LYKINNISFGGAFRQPDPHISNTADNTSMTPTHSVHRSMLRCRYTCRSREFIGCIVELFQRIHGYCTFTWWCYIQVLPTLYVYRFYLHVLSTCYVRVFYVVYRYYLYVMSY